MAKHKATSKSSDDLAAQQPAVMKRTHSSPTKGEVQVQMDSVGVSGVNTESGERGRSSTIGSNTGENTPYTTGSNTPSVPATPTSESFLARDTDADLEAALSSLESNFNQRLQETTNLEPGTIDVEAVIMGAKDDKQELRNSKITLASLSSYVKANKFAVSSACSSFESLRAAEKSASSKLGEPIPPS